MNIMNTYEVRQYNEIFENIRFLIDIFEHVLLHLFWQCS